MELSSAQFSRALEREKELREQLKAQTQHVAELQTKLSTIARTADTLIESSVMEQRARKPPMKLAQMKIKKPGEITDQI